MWVLAAVKHWYKQGAFAKPPNILVCVAREETVEMLWEQMKGQCKETARRQRIIPLLLPSLGTAALTCPSLLMHAVSLSRDWSRCQGSPRHKGSGGLWPWWQLNIPSPALQICLSHFVFSASHEREMGKKQQRLRGEGRRGGYCIPLQALGVYLCRSLGLSERSCGEAALGRLDAQWECCLGLFDVPGPFSLIPSLPSGLFALQRN